ncbi:SAP domain containing protein [Gracilaria domingensis]|nr:SAP domain containing protein [Gracilaria domingensis]
MSGTMSGENNAPEPFSCCITVIQASGDTGKSFEFDTKNWCVLGSHQDCDIRIKHSLNAPLHALVLVRPKGVHLIGLHSDLPVHHPRTGTYLVKEDELPLLPGDNFYLGDRGFRVDFESPSMSSPKSPCLPVSEALGPQTRSAKKAATETKAAQRSQSSGRKRKSKRRVSLVVEASGERFVSQKRDTERLLSKTQIARLSDGDGIQTSAKSMAQETEFVGHEVQPEEETQDPQPQPHTEFEQVRSTSEENENDFQEESCKPKIEYTEGEISIKETEVQDGNIKLGAHQTVKEARARKMSLPPTPKTRNPVRVAKSASKQKSLTARERKKLVYARLSLGLTAHPSKNEIAEGLETNPTVAFASRSSTSHDFKLNLDLHQSSNQVMNHDIGEKSLIRSPLADKSPILNIQRNVKISGGVSKDCWTPSAMKKCPGSVLRSSKSTTRGKNRSVAFASKIELERGKHYSPFRPSVPRRTSELRSNQEVTIEPSRLSLDWPVDMLSSPLALNSCGRLWSETEKEQAGGFEVSPDLRLEQEAEAHEDDTDSVTLTDASDCVPDSNSSHEESSSDTSASRLTGAISSLFKRLSANGEQQKTEDKGSAVCSSGKSHVSDSKSAKLSDCKASTEPLMSADELQDLSRSTQMSVSRRLSFLDKVRGAAAAVRNVMADDDQADADTVKHPRESSEADSLKALFEEVKKDESSMDGAASCANDQVESDLLCNDVRNSSGAICEELEGETGEATDPSTDTGTEQVSKSLAQDKEHLASNELQSNAASSDNLSATSVPKKRLSLASIFERLSRGTGEQAKPETDAPSNETLDDADDAGSLERTNSYDTKSIDSQDTADTFERDLEVRVRRASYLSRSTSTGEDLETDINGLITEKDTDTPSAEALSRHNGASHLDQAEEDEDTDRRDPAVDRDEQGQMGEMFGQDGTETSLAAFSPKSPDVSCSRGEQRRSSQLGSESKSCEGSIVDPSEETGSIEEPGTSGIKTDELEEEHDLDAEHDLKAELKKLLVVELKEKLRSLNMNFNGRKAELVQRLVEQAEREQNEFVLREMREGYSDEEVNEEEEVEDLGTSQSEVDRETSESTVIAIPSDSEEEDGNEMKSDANVELYRRKTVKELRQILKDRDLDIMSKLRKEELIQHMIAEGVKLPEQDEEASNVESPSSGRTLRSTRKTRQTPATSRRGRPPAAKGTAPPTAKSLNRLTVAELRSRLQERNLSQQGTKRVLIDRLLSESQSFDDSIAASEEQ